ncbi:MAG: DUF5602 domain-containing protein [Flavobacterium sp.]|nr:DUF5602 domain-containing protein [Pedobacter sp.]
MKNLKQQFMGLGILAVLIFAGCEPDAAIPESQLTQQEGKTFYCDKVNFCHGTIQSFVTMDSENKPMSLGVRFSESILTNLPSDPMKNVKEAVLKIPKEAKDVGIDHIELGWNPQGHEPDPIYTLPHFDLHFYKVSSSEQASVVPGPDLVTVMSKYIPTDYISGVIAVPNMGVHYVDLTSPEFTGSQFDKTFIYGFYKGSMTFLEPMFTRTFLQTKPNITIPIKQPASFQKAGYYPTSYRISHNAGNNEYVVALDGLKYHAAD